MNKQVNVPEADGLKYETYVRPRDAFTWGQHRTKSRAQPPAQGNGSLRKWMRTHPVKRGQR